MAQGKRGIVAEFQEFISRGNVIDLAVGVIIGGAFTTVVNSLVSNIITPLLSFLTGGAPGVPGMSITLGGQTIDFSAFIGDVISFLITAAAVFSIVKGVNAFNEMRDLAAERAGLPTNQGRESATEPRTCPYCRQEIADEATRCPHCTAALEGYDNPLER